MIWSAFLGGLAGALVVPVLKDLQKIVFCCPWCRKWIVMKPVTSDLMLWHVKCRCGFECTRA